MFGPRRRRMPRREGLGLLLLFHQLYQVGVSRIPPATLATLAANILIFLRVLNPYMKLIMRSPSIKNICVSSAHVWYKGDWPRLFLAAWFHLDDWHLYYNMVSFVWKGISLERKFGTLYFAYLIFVFSGLTNAVLVMLNIGIAELLEDSSHIVSCAAGFSGVLFALKVLTTYYTPVHNQRIMGLFSVPSRWACWVELILIQLIVPRASFTGHLAGILVGLAFVKGPLKVVMDAVWHLFTSVVSGRPSSGAHIQSRQEATGYGRGGPGRPGSAWGQGYTTGSADRPRPSQRDRSHAETDQGRSWSNGSGWGSPAAAPTLPSYRADDFTGGLSEDDQLREAMRNSVLNNSNNHQENQPEPSAPPYPEDEGTSRLYPDLSQNEGHPPPAYARNESGGAGPSADELRRRRLAHYAR